MINSEQIIDITKRIETLKTGDLLLCDNLEQKGLGLFGWLIKYGSQSDFSHIAMVVVNPDFTYLDKPLKGVYVWQSGTAQIPDAEDGKRKIGVQLTPIIDFITTYKGKIYLRRLHVHVADVLKYNFKSICVKEKMHLKREKNNNIFLLQFVAENNNLNMYNMINLDIYNLMFKLNKDNFEKIELCDVTPSMQIVQHDKILNEVNVLFLFKHFDKQN